MRGVGVPVLVIAVSAACSSADGSTDIAGPSTSATSTAAVPSTTALPAATASTTAAPKPTDPPVGTSAAPSAAGAGLCEPAPPDASGIATGPDWFPGEVRQLEVESGRSGSGSDSPGGLAVTPVELEVLDAGPDGYRFAWRAATSDVVVAGASPATAEAAEDVLAELPTPTIVYSVTADHEYLGVENTEEMRAALIESIDFLAERGVIPEDEAFERVRGLYETLDGPTIDQLLTEEIRTFHLFDGVELADGEQVRVDDLLPNALGGEPFPAETVIELTRIVDEDGCVEIVQTTTPDPVRFGEILAESVVASGLVPAGTPLDEVDLVFEVENRIIAQYDYASGRVRQIRATQRVEVDTTTQTDTLIVRDTTDD